MTGSVPAGAAGRAAILAVSLTGAAASAADTRTGSALEAFVDAIDRGDAEGCATAFVDGAGFVDLGRDMSDRIGWFCQAVVDAGGRYTVESVTVADGVTRWTFSYAAGSYAIEGVGLLREDDGRIRHLVIERR